MNKDVIKEEIVDEQKGRCDYTYMLAPTTKIHNGCSHNTVALEKANAYGFAMTL